MSTDIPATVSAETVTSWSDDVDVTVIGFGAAGGGQRDGVVGGYHTGDCVGRDFADGVAGHDDVLAGEHASARQFLVGQQSRGDDQWLGDRGVGDLLGRGGGAQPGKI